MAKMCLICELNEQNRNNLQILKRSRNANANKHMLSHLV